jgi:hypothetical protein
VPAFICTACGTQFPASAAAPPACPICEDERQFVPVTGQGWTTLDRLRLTHRNTFRKYRAQLYALGTAPSFAIGQRAFLARTPAGNVLWDCLTLLDDATVDILNGLGGVAAIAISHPHYYASMREWSAAFGVPVYIHASDRQWVVDPFEAISFWDGGELEILPGATLLCCGGHFDGGSVLHIQAQGDEPGYLLTGDVIQIAPGRGSASFMWSYPNMIPLPAAAISRIASVIHPPDFTAAYGAFWDREIETGAKPALLASAERYRRMIGDAPQPGDQA